MEEKDTEEISEVVQFQVDLEPNSTMAEIHTDHKEDMEVQQNPDDLDRPSDEVESTNNLCISISDSSYSYNPLTKSMYEMAQKKQFCDTEIIPCEGETCWAHSTVLASRCEILKQTFLMSSTSKYKIRSEEITSSTWKIWLEYIYLGSVDIQPSQLKNLLAAADTLEMEDLKNQCKVTYDEQILLGNIIDTNKVDQETEIEPDLMKFAAGLSDNLEFVSTIDEEDGGAGGGGGNDETNAGQSRMITSEMSQENGVQYIQVEETVENNKAIFYMVQDQTGGGQNYILTTQEPNSSTSVAATNSENGLQVITEVEANGNSRMIAFSEDNIDTDVTSQTEEEASNSENYKSILEIKYPAGINPRSIGRPREMKKEVNKDMVYKCGVCQKLFKSKQSLDNHMLLHSENHPFTCELCGKCFKTDRYLKCHIMRHSEDRSYQCPVCGKSFKTSRDANWHRKTVHSSTRPFQCQYCHYAAKTKALLNQHMESHTTNKGWHCKTCSKSFLRKQHLEQHEARHEGKRQYMCSTCGSEFFTIYACKEHHMRVHQGIKRYECSVCHQQYNEKKSFMKHLQKHSVDLVLKLDGGDIIIEQTVEEAAVVDVINAKS